MEMYVLIVRLPKKEDFNKYYRENENKAKDLEIVLKAGNPNLITEIVKEKI